MRQLMLLTRAELIRRLWLYSYYQTKSFDLMSDLELFNFASHMLRMGSAWRTEKMQDEHDKLLAQAHNELYADELVENELLRDPTDNI
jgi:hypothetical protein